MKLTSSAFEHNGEIPKKYTCQGEDISPPLNIEDVPVSAKSLILIMDDPDIPDFVKQKFKIQEWDHWILFNIDQKTKIIKEDSSPGILGKNTSNKNIYQGPCPPDKRHRYFFRLYALDCLLRLQEGATKKQVLDATKGRILGQTELIGTYEKS